MASTKRRDESSIFFVPMATPQDVQKHLAHPSHWKEGRSAERLASVWFAAKGIPKSVRNVLETCTSYGTLEVLVGAFEHTTRLDDFSRASQTDLLVVARSPQGAGSAKIAVIAVEGKVDESFDLPVNERRLRARKGSRWPERLEGLCRKLGLSITAVDAIRYQLLHRSVAALIEAGRFGAKEAMLLVHSFARDNENDHFEDFVAFARLLGIKNAGKNRVSSACKIGGVNLRLAWVAEYRK
jgi:hypothetical protein